MEKWDRIVIRNGNPVMLGANKNEEGMNFAAEVLPGAEAALVLYQKGSAVPCREIPFTERMGKVCTMLVSGLNTKKYDSSEFGETEKMKTRSAVPFLQKRNMTGRKTGFRRFHTGI